MLNIIKKNREKKDKKVMKDKRKNEDGKKKF